MFLIAEKHDDGLYYLRRKPSSEHSRILAITFTNKATNEMTRRIIKELAILAGMAADDELAELGLTPGERHESTSKSGYYKDFMNPDTGLHCDTDSLRKAARTALTDLLYDYSYFNVSTIDSFFQSVLRMFTREVELPENYNVELNSTYATAIGVDEMFNSLSYKTIAGTPENVHQKWIKEWLLAYMRNKMANGSSFNMFSRGSALYRSLIKNLDDIANEDFKRRINGLRPYFADTERLKRFEHALVSLVRDARSTAVGLFRKIKDSIPVEVLNTSKIDRLERGELLDSDTYLEKATTEPIKFINRSKCKKMGIEVSTGDLDLVGEYAMAYSRLKQLVTEFKPIIDRIHVFGLLSTVTRNIDEFCREKSMVLLSETNNILKGLINDDETPFIYERLGYYLNHFLIDEFQDTSPMQWENIKPLVMESLSRNNDNLVIGDEKQCIYRFRNSDPRLLGRMVQEETIERFDSEDVIKISGTDIKENSNWRSGIEIVRFNNTLFKCLAETMETGGGNADMLSTRATYANIIQQIDPKRKELHGYVKLKIEPKDKAADEPRGDEAALAFMLKEIKRQLNAGYKPCDIAILVRSHSQGAKVIEKLLAAMNDPSSGLPHFDILSEDALRLSASSAVRLIVSILRLVSIPEFLEVDEKAKALVEGCQPPTGLRMSEEYRRVRLLNRYMFYLHHTHEDGKPYSTSEALEKALRDNRESVADDGKDDRLKSLLDMDYLSLQGVVERIIHRFVPERLKERENLFLTTFQDAVIEYSHNNGHDIRSFLMWWDKTGYKTALTTPPNSNAMTVMTIHKSKGLEFPCVHIPFGNRELFSSSLSWVDLDGECFAPLGIDPADVPCAMPLEVTTKMKDSAIYGASCNEVITQARVDELNVAYVAYTRPTRELCIHYAYNNRTESIGKKLAEAIAMATDGYIAGLNLPPDTARWLIPLADCMEGDTLTVGSPTLPETKKKKTSTIKRLDINAYTTTDAAMNTLVRAKTDTIEPMNIADQRHLGNFLHAVMSGVTTPDRLELSMRREAYRHHIGERAVGQLRARLERALSNPDARRWFENFDRVITERSISVHDANCRPDRIVWLPDGSIEVVDYKFVNSLPDDLAKSDSHKRYMAKLDEYCTAVKGHAHDSLRNRGMPDVAGYLWYIAPDEDLIVQVYPFQ